MGCVVILYRHCFIKYTENVLYDDIVHHYCNMKLSISQFSNIFSYQPAAMENVIFTIRSEDKSACDAELRTY